jgi:hypothetical protein
MQVSNYFVLQDGNFELDEGEIKRFTAKMPPSSQFVKATARPILGFNMHPLTSERLKFLVILNDIQGDPNNIPNSKVVWSYDSGDDVRLLRSTHEVLDGEQFSPGVDNVIDFRVIVGKVRLSDVVLHFRVET